MLEGVARQRLSTLKDGEVEVAVIDNSADGNAAPRIGTLKPAYRFALDCRHVADRGLAVARNAAIAAVLERKATHLVFIDDDECPEPDWLEALLEAVATPGTAAAVGPVLPLSGAAAGLAAGRRLRHPGDLRR